jgi:putative tryptophan/tyrosine transport system substrate-binding protein
MKNLTALLSLIILLSYCSPASQRSIPVIGFLDAFEDATIAQAKSGFYDALNKNGFSEQNKTIEIIYRNAEGDIPTLTQACDYFLSKNVDLIAANATLSMITAVQKTKDIPVCMMVSPRPDLAGLTDVNGNAPANLFGVYETLDYIDTSVSLIKNVFPGTGRLGTIYNQSEPNSVAACNRVKSQCEKLGLELLMLPVNNSSETQLVVQSLLTKNIDAFFALPDNTVFSSFEVIAKTCDEAHVPIFTSEAGLVKRGALAAFGADMYQWGFQAGEQAVRFLKTRSLKEINPEIVKTRKRVYNPEEAVKFKVRFDASFVPVN